jgi:hypothetical protein
MGRLDETRRRRRLMARVCWRVVPVEVVGSWRL